MFLRIERLVKIYHNRNVVDEISVEVNSGDIIGIIGENGAGKTTLLRMICGHIKPTSGIIEMEEDVIIGGLIENPGIIPYLSAEENLKAKQLFLGRDNLEERKKLLNMVGLDDNNKKAKLYSLGMKQRLGIALAAVGNSNLLVLDEPTNGLDPMGIIDIRNFLKDLNEKEGKTILISSHYLEELSKIANKFIFIKNGKVVYTCSREKLPDKMSLEDLYIEHMGGKYCEKIN